MRKILSSKKLIVTFSIFILSLSILKVCLDSITLSLETTSQDMVRLSRKSSITEVNKRIKELESVMSVTQPPYMNQNEASRFLAETAENIKRMYDGKYFGVIKQSGSKLYVDLEFTIKPESTDIVPKIADYLENSTSPIIYVNRIVFKQTDASKDNQLKTVTFKITMVQPFYGGTYEY